MRLASKRPDVQRVLDLQRDAGNRAVQQLVGPFAVQRSCDCGGTCARCSAADDQSSANDEVLSRLVVGVQRAPLDSGVGAPLIVADGTAAGSGQMTKTQFLTTLRQRVTATAQTAFVGSDWTAQDCPALGRWFGYYASKDAAHIERALRSYAPGGATGATAESYIDAACRRVAISVGAFVLTGKIVGLPAEIAGQDLSDGGDPSATRARRRYGRRRRAARRSGRSVARAGRGTSPARWVSTPRACACTPITVLRATWTGWTPGRSRSASASRSPPAPSGRARSKAMR